MSEIKKMCPVKGYTLKDFDKLGQHVASNNRYERCLHADRISCCAREAFYAAATQLAARSFLIEARRQDTDS